MFIFGDKNLNLENFKTNHSHLTPILLQQVHSTIIIEQKAALEIKEATHILNLTSSSQSKADGHYTTQNNLALGIVTADCMPVFIFSEKTIFAIHAGWRGALNGIVDQALNLIKSEFKNESFQLYVGPHIQKDSFEVSKDVAQQFYQKNSQCIYSHQEQNKAYVSLTDFIYPNIKQTPQIKDVQFSNINTFTNQNYNSYRREKEQAKRNLSFIWL